MKYIALVVGCFATFKAGPVSIAGFLSLSDIACLISISLFAFLVFTEVTLNGRLRILNIGVTAIAPFVVVLVFAMGHGMVTGGEDLTNFITMAIVFASIYSLVNIAFFLREPTQIDVAIDYYFFGILIGLIAPYILNKIGLANDASVYFYPGGRYKGYMNHQNQIGLLSTTCFCFFLVQNVEMKTKITRLLFASIPLLLCTSKFNIGFSFACAALYFSYFYLPLPKYINIIIVGAIIISAYVFVDDLIDGGVYILSAVNPEGADRLADFAASPEDSEATSSRTYVWGQAIIVGTANLPFGIGPSAAPPHLMFLSHAHNALLNYYLIYGLGGTFYIVSVVVIILRLIWRCRRYPQARSAAVAAFCGFIASNISDSFSNSASLPILGAVALAYAAARRWEKREWMTRHPTKQMPAQ